VELKLRPSKPTENIKRRSKDERRFAFYTPPNIFPYRFPFRAYQALRTSL